MNARYNAADIEVLTGLDPVKRRPGMYTDTSRPNHLAQEVVDNAVDEALAGHAKAISIALFADGSCEVSDDGRGMPVDIHPEEKIPGVELILTRLHADAATLKDDIQQTVARVMRLSPAAARMHKQMMRTWMQASDAMLDAQCASAYDYADSPEHREGITAFIDKRPARF